MQACHARQDLPSYYRLNREIHSCFNQAAHNHLLAQVYSTLNQRVQNLRFRSNLNPDKWNRAMGEHIAMVDALARREGRSEEHTSELQSLMRISYAVFCLKKKTTSLISMYRQKSIRQAEQQRK